MTTFHDAAYTMAAVTATIALYRTLIKKGLLTREEAARVLLDEAVGFVLGQVIVPLDPHLGQRGQLLRGRAW